MLDWLAIWGVTQAAGFAFGAIMQELAKEGAKEYGKEFFKNSLGKVLHLSEKDAQKEAYGKALKAFLEIFQQQLEMAELNDDEVKAYEKSLKIFIDHSTVETILGDAFAVNCQTLDTSTLAKTWQNLNLPKLPHQFNWEKVGKFYLRKVKEIIETSDKLREIFLVQAQFEDTKNLQKIAGTRKDFDLEHYAEGLKKEYGNLKLESLDTTTYEQIKLWRMFVPQKVKRCNQFIPQLYEYPKEILQKLLDRGEIDRAGLELIEELERKRREYFNEQLYLVLDIVNSDYKKIVILGDPGAGKSTLLQYLALNWAEKNISERSLHPLPLLVELRTYARDKKEKKCKDFLEFFHQGNLLCHLNQHSLDQKLKKGQVIALFDGLDEVFDPQLRDEIVTDIKRLSNDYPQVQIVATSRWLGYKAEDLSNAGFEHFMLQDLEQDQIQEFIQRWHDLAFQDREDKTRKQERLQKAIQESKAIRELAGNPLLLTMMAILNRTQELPRDRPKLYERASEVLLHQWDFETKEGLKDPELKKYLYNIDLRDKKEMLRSVANAMQAGDKGLAANLIYREDLESILTNYLKSTGIARREAIDLTDLIIKQLRHRNFILCSLGGNSFAFVHRTFLEYFCACEFYERFKKRDLAGGMTLEEIKTEVFGQHWQDSSWREVLRLLIGMLSAEFPKEIAEELIDYLIQKNSTATQFSNIFLAADCFSELRNRSAYSKISNQLLDKLKFLVKSHNILLTKQAAIAALAKHWRDHPETFLFIQKLAHKGDRIVIDALAKHWRDHPETFPFIQQQAHKGEWSAIDALAEYWRDHPETFPFIQQQAHKGDSSAIYALAKHWRDHPETFPFIQQQAHKGEWSAIDALARHWHDHPETLPIILQQAHKGERSAIDALIPYWPDHPKTLPIILQQAQIGEKIAIYALAKHWRDHPKTLPIILQQAQIGEEIAIYNLIEYWRDDSETLPIILQQAQIGEKIAIYALAKHWRDHPKTLPFIQKQAKKGESRAIAALIQHWRDYPQTLPILKQAIRQDEDTFITILQDIIISEIIPSEIVPEIQTLIEEYLAEPNVSPKLREEYEYLLKLRRLK